MLECNRSTTERAMSLAKAKSSDFERGNGGGGEVRGGEETRVGAWWHGY